MNSCALAKFGRALDLLAGRAGLAVGDVLRQRAVEQDRLLLHDRDLRAQAGLRHAGDVVAVDRDAPAIHVVQPLDQLDERGLARAGEADQPDLLARADGDAEPVIERLMMAAIVKDDTIECDRPCRITIGLAPILSSMPRGWAWISTSSSMSFTDFCRSRMYDADVAQIALDHDIGRHHIGDVAGAGLAGPPQMAAQGR